MPVRLTCSAVEMGAKGDLGVTLDLEESQTGGGVDHRLEQPGHHVLRMSQARSMEAHERRVSPDISDDQESPPHRHIGMIRAPSMRGQRRRS